MVIGKVPYQRELIRFAGALVVARAAVVFPVVPVLFPHTPRARCAFVNRIAELGGRVLLLFSFCRGSFFFLPPPLSLIPL